MHALMEQDKDFWVHRPIHLNHWIMLADVAHLVDIYDPGLTAVVLRVCPTRQPRKPLKELLFDIAEIESVEEVVVDLGEKIFCRIDAKHMNLLEIDTRIGTHDMIGKLDDR